MHTVPVRGPAGKHDEKCRASSPGVCRARGLPRRPGPPRLLPRMDWYILSDMHACHFCSAPIENPREVYRSSTCSRCGKDLKICLNCRFYSPGAHWDCSETIDEMVKDKDRANFCTFFSFRQSSGAKGAARPDAAEQAKRKMDKLFGNDT